MNYRKAIKRAAIIVPVLIVLWCWSFPLWPLRYQLTLEVETPEGLKTGASVMAVEITHIRPLKIFQQPPQFALHGQAVIVDLGARGILFATLAPQDKSPYNLINIVLEVFRAQTIEPTDLKFDYSSALRAKADLTVVQLPHLVRFRDLNDPLSVEEVDPNDLTKTFGLDVGLKRATIEMMPAGTWPFNRYDIGGSDELRGMQVTTGIDRKLSWLPQYIGKKLDGGHDEYSGAKNRIANKLGGGSFRTWR